MKKALKIVSLSIVILVLFRGVIFRALFKYEEIGIRPTIEITNHQLIEKIQSKLVGKVIGLETIMETANEISIEELRYVATHASNNPNELIISKEANCIGYAAMYNSIANYIIEENRLQYELIAEHKIGEIYFLNMNVNKWFGNPFLKNHDFNEIVLNTTGDKFLKDPSISDVLWINEISGK